MPPPCLHAHTLALCNSRHPSCVPFYVGSASRGSRNLSTHTGVGLGGSIGHTDANPLPHRRCRLGASSGQFVTNGTGSNQEVNTNNHSTTCDTNSSHMCGLSNNRNKNTCDKKLLCLCRESIPFGWFYLMGIICHPILCLSLFDFCLLHLRYQRNQQQRQQKHPTGSIRPRNYHSKVAQGYGTTPVN